MDIVLTTCFMTHSGVITISKLVGRVKAGYRGHSGGASSAYKDAFYYDDATIRAPRYYLYILLCRHIFRFSSY